MTRLPRTALTEREGVNAVEAVCVEAGMIFRPTPHNDVGIDGIIEGVEDEAATGIMIGVQIKSGESFVSEDHETYRFKADQDHFGYWARCNIPVIGVVYSPKSKQALWVDLSGLCTEDRIADGPYVEAIAVNEGTAFNAENLLSTVVPTMVQYVKQRFTLWQVRELVAARKESAMAALPKSGQRDSEVVGTKEQAWQELIEIFLATSSTDEDIAEAGYRLSWHFPAVSEKLKSLLLEHLTAMGDFQLVRILRTIHRLIEHNADPDAQLIEDLLAYIPGISERTELILKDNRIASDHREGAIQVLEGLTQELRNDLRFG